MSKIGFGIRQLYLDKGDHSKPTNLALDELDSIRLLTELSTAPC